MIEVKEQSGYRKANVSGQNLSGSVPVIDLSRGGLKSAFAAFAAKEKSPLEAGAKDNKAQNKPAEAKAEQPARDDQDKQPEAKNQDASRQDQENTAKKPATLEQTGYTPPQAFAPKFAPTIAAGALSMVQQKAAQRPKASYEDPDHETDADVFNLGKRSLKRVQKGILDEDSGGYGNNSASKSDEMMQNYAQWQQQQENRIFAQTLDSFIDNETRRLNLEAKQHEENIAKLKIEQKAAIADRDNAATALETTRAEIVENDTVKASTSAAITTVENDITKLKETAEQNDKAIAAKKAVIDNGKEALAGATAAAQDEAAKAQENDEKATNLNEAERLYNRAASKAQEDVEKITAEMQAGEQKLLKDEQGNTIHQDEKGNFYSLGADGKKQEYSAEEQQKLKEKQEAESLVTADKLEEKRQELAKAQENLEGYKKGKEFATQAKHEATDAASEARGRGRVYENIKASLKTELEGHEKKLDELETEGKNIQQQLTEKASELTILKEKLKEATEKGVKLSAKEQAQLEDFTKKELRVKEIENELAKEEKAFSKTKTNIQALEQLDKKRNDPEMQARLNSNDPAVKKAAREELMSTLPPDMRARFKEEWQENKKEWEKNKQLAAQQPNAQTSTPTATTSTDNTSRNNGSAAPPAIAASADVGDQFAAAAAGTPTTANEPAPVADKELVATVSTPKASTAAGMSMQ